MSFPAAAAAVPLLQVVILSLLTSQLVWPQAKSRLEHHAGPSVSPNSTSLQLLRIKEELGNAASWR
ncbi:hypothetical protein ACP70R_041332 [Stipagrostis hirtigluma subsp. patula]